MILLWTSDTGAYLAGRSLGKHKLFERISPKKTWEGFIGGIVLAVLVSLCLAHYFETIPQWQWIIVAMIIAVFGTLGDLVESMLKRSLNVKDSGHILPGHGGLLDRFDGLLIAGPLVYLFLFLVN
ncbi:Phosphatidate cytidylyltransferase [compost metagenome]